MTDEFDNATASSFKQIKDLTREEMIEEILSTYRRRLIKESGLEEPS